MSEITISAASAQKPSSGGESPAAAEEELEASLGSPIPDSELLKLTQQIEEQEIASFGTLDYRCEEDASISSHLSGQETISADSALVSVYPATDFPAMSTQNEVAIYQEEQDRPRSDSSLILELESVDCTLRDQYTFIDTNTDLLTKHAAVRRSTRVHSSSDLRRYFFDFRDHEEGYPVNRRRRTTRRVADSEEDADYHPVRTKRARHPRTGPTVKVILPCVQEDVTESPGTYDDSPAPSHPSSPIKRTYAKADRASRLNPGSSTSISPRRRGRPPKPAALLRSDTSTFTTQLATTPSSSSPLPPPDNSLLPAPWPIPDSSQPVAPLDFATQTSGYVPYPSSFVPGTLISSKTADWISTGRLTLAELEWMVKEIHDVAASFTRFQNRYMNAMHHLDHLNIPSLGCGKQIDATRVHMGRIERWANDNRGIIQRTLANGGVETERDRSNARAKIFPEVKVQQ